MMRPTFMGFEASKTALFSAQKSMDITGHNLSNVDTEGYSRQRVVQTANSAGGYPSRLAINQVTYAGMGVDVQGVQQLRSEQLDTAFRNENSLLGYYDANSNLLGQIEGVLQELDEGDYNGYGLREGVSNLYIALQDFSTNANSEPIAAVVAEAMGNICNILNDKYEQLESLQGSFLTEFSARTDRANEIFKEIAVLNDRIESSIYANNYEGQYGPNELKDQRNLLIDELSTMGVVEVTEISRIHDSKVETVGGLVIKFNGHTAVNGRDYDRLMLTNVKEETTGKDRTQLHWRSTSDVMTFGKGELQSFLNVLNGSGPNPLNEMDTRDRGLPFYKDKLDAFAQTLADVFNNIVPAVDDTITPPVDKTDEFGNTIYRNFFGEMTADGTVITFEKVSAKNISISNALKSDSSYLIYDKNSTVNDYTVKMLDQLITKEHKFDTASDDYTGTFEDYITDFNVALGNDISFSNTNFAASAVITQEILNSRDSVMGVTETEETANMLIFNRAFQAAARMMNTMDSMLDLIVNRLGIG